MRSKNTERIIESGTIFQLCFVFSDCDFEDYLMPFERSFHSDKTKEQDKPATWLY